jgi:hypothetical protein
VLWIRIGFNADLDPDPESPTNADRPYPDQTLKSIQDHAPGSGSTFPIRIPIRIGFNADLDPDPESQTNADRPDPGQTLKYMQDHAPGSGYAFPIRIRIQDSQINVDPCGSGSTTLSRSQDLDTICHPSTN